MRGAEEATGISLGLSLGLEGPHAFQGELFSLALLFPSPPDGLTWLPAMIVGPGWPAGLKNNQDRPKDAARLPKGS